jgi:3-methyladenine DNA glycosylase/8-oxoguanine DNA glycosylase
MRTPDGPAALHVRAEGPAEIRAEAWGAGADWALDHAPGLVGAEDDDAGFVPHHDVIRELWRRHRAVRLVRTADVMPVLLAAILEQKVVGVEARRAWRRMVRAMGEPAPGPEPTLLLPPDPARLAELPYHAFHPFGVERRRAEVIRAVCALAETERGAVLERIGRIRGIGPWTLAETARLAFGDPDAVSVGDYHLPNIVAWALAGEPRGDDRRMLDLLEPYRGHRARVQRLLEAGHVAAPGFGPRLEARAIDRF